MDLLIKSIEELAANYTSRMDEFQKEFQVFRAFVMTALQNLQLQLQLLSRQQDDMEVRSRRRMLLVHGLPEERDEKPAVCVAKFLSERLTLPDITVGAISRCHRLGRPNSDKPRAVLVNFRDQDLRDKAWFAKTKLKASGVTLSEFMTKARHEAFVSARKRFGVSQCWTRDGCVVVLGPDGTRHRVVSVAEVNAIPEPVGITPKTAASVPVLATPRHNITVRAKKPARN